MHACVRACVGFVCVCVCARTVRKGEGQDQRQQPFILIRPGQPCLHTRLYMEIHMLRSRSEQEVETDGVTEEYEQQVATDMPVRVCVCVCVCV